MLRSVEIGVGTNEGFTVMKARSIRGVGSHVGGSRGVDEVKLVLEELILLFYTDRLDASGLQSLQGRRMEEPYLARGHKYGSLGERADNLITMNWPAGTIKY